MAARPYRIGVVAPSRSIDANVADPVKALAGDLYGDKVELVFHPQCFLSHGHFAGPDDARAAAFVEMANDPSYDALWFARGGYGASRLLDRAIHDLKLEAFEKRYLGYSDAGFLLAALYGQGCARVAHGPMPVDIVRPNGAAAIERALAYLVQDDAAALEPTCGPDVKTAAFNLTVLAHLIGTPWAPDLSHHVVMVEDTGEHLYRVDRALVHVTSATALRHVAGWKLGRVDNVLENDIGFAETAEECAERCCKAAGAAWLGRADIGHDAGNKVVVFGERKAGA